MITATLSVPLLDTDPKRFGPVSKRLTIRFLLGHGTVELVGFLLIVAGHGRARAAGLSMMVPGAGLLYGAMPLLFLVAVGIMVFAVVMWWGVSALWGVPLWWAATVVASAVLLDGPRLVGARGTTWTWVVPLVPIAALALIGSAVYRFEHIFRRKRAAVPEINRYLATATFPAAKPEFIVPNDIDVELVRWVYSMALQPLDGFDGFDWGEQFHGPTCARYQLNFLGWSLAMFSANYVPNSPATAERAMANLIEKHTDLRVSRYWHSMHLIGNFNRNPDPRMRGVAERIAGLRDRVKDGELDREVVPRFERSTRYRTAGRWNADARGAHVGPLERPDVHVETGIALL